MLATELEKRVLKVAVVGIPKTIDNDIDLIDKVCFENSYHSKKEFTNAL